MRRNKRRLVFPKRRRSMNVRYFSINFVASKLHLRNVLTVYVLSSCNTKDIIDDRFVGSRQNYPKVGRSAAGSFIIAFALIGRYTLTYRATMFIAFHFVAKPTTRGSLVVRKRERFSLL